jgi:hypothetical protein
MMDENEKQPDFSENEKELIDEDYTADIDLSGYFLEKARIQEEEKKAEETRKKEKEEKSKAVQEDREEKKEEMAEAGETGKKAKPESFEQADQAFEKAKEGRKAFSSTGMPKIQLDSSVAAEIRSLGIQIPKAEEKQEEEPVEEPEQQTISPSAAVPDHRAAVKAQRRRWSRLYVAVCAAIVLSVTAMGIVLHRPSHSEVEKRDLATFPKISLAGVMNGSFFSDLMTWYADTYPVREQMISAEASIQDHYGIGQRIVIKDAATADAVPDADKVDVAPTLEIPSAASSDSSEESTAAETAETAESSAGVSTAEETAEKDGSASTESSEENAPDGAITDEPEAVGTIYIAGGSGFSVYFFNKEAVDTYASMVNTVAAHLPDCDVYAMPTPNNFGIMLSEDIQRELSQPEQGVFTYMFAKMSDDVKKVNVYQNLLDHNSEYVYFRTDHHWTALGAYYAYETFCDIKGITPTPIDSYRTQVSEGFLGSYYAYSNHSPELAANPDTITAYIPIATNTMKMTQADGSVVDYPIIQEGDTYSVFIGGDEPLEVIDNPDLNDGSSVILIKDSYGDAFAPFLVDSYDKVYIADFRYCDPHLAQFITDNNIHDVILENNVEFLTTQNATKVLADFGFTQ